MNTTTLVLLAVMGGLFFLYLARRRNRLNQED
jgi:ABC-type Fe3+-siderophore transport system permease subunit